MSKTQPARGMRDFLPADVRKRNYVIGIIKEVYESYGFEPLETPAVENLETLTGKYGEDSKLIYKILKRGEHEKTGEADLALRYDLTVPLARVVAQYRNDLPKFFKRYQIQPVWRADRPARGRYREFYQCDVDQIGSTSMLVEAELCSAVSEILQRLGFDDFVIRVNHREILTALLDSAGIAEDRHADALIALDKIDKIGIDGVAEELSARNLTGESVEKLLSLYKFLSRSPHSAQSPNVSGKSSSAENESPIVFADEDEVFSLVGNLVAFKKISEFTAGNEKASRATSELLAIISYAQKAELKNSSAKTVKRIKFDVSLARGLSYYTGAIFEINVPDLAGSLGGGGRYDGLIGMFGKEQIPACGFSLGLERILVVMEERGMFQKLIESGELNLNSADVLVACFDEALVGECLKLAADLRRENLRVLVYPEAKGNAKPVKYAEQINAAFVCLLRENELADGKVTLKNMRTGEQETVERKDIFSKINV